MVKPMEVLRVLEQSSRFDIIVPEERRDFIKNYYMFRDISERRENQDNPVTPIPIQTVEEQLEIAKGFLSRLNMPDDVVVDGTDGVSIFDDLPEF